MDHHRLTDYQTPPGIPVVLHENLLLKVSYNGFYHYVDMRRYAGGVVILPRHENGDLQFVQLQRAPTHGVMLELPRGGMEPGETPLAAARRELLEETGYDLPLENFRTLGRVAGDSATLNSFLHIIAANIPSGSLQTDYRTNEIRMTVRMSPAAIQSLVRAGDIYDGYTLSALYLAAGAPWLPESPTEETGYEVRNEPQRISSTE